jgi:hypothetical protein
MLPIILMPFVSKLQFQRFHGDESYWLRSTKCFKLFFIDKDLHSRQWENLKIEPVGKYIIGLTLYIAGYGDRIDELSRMWRWNWRKDFNWNVVRGRVPPKETVYVARLAMALFGSFTCLLIYWIGRILWGVKAGIISSLLLAYNPLMLVCSRRAMTDAPLLFFLTSNIILVIYFYRSLLKQKLLRTFVFAVLIGINSALAAGTKLNGGLAGLIFSGFCIFVVLIKGVHYSFSKGSLRNRITKFITDRTIKAALISLFISGVIATLVFVGMNPSLYSKPLEGSFNMIEYRMSQVSLQQKHNVLIDSFSKKVDFTFRRTLFPGNNVILGNIYKIPIEFALFLLGLTMLLYNEVKYLFENSKPSFKSIIILWTFITFIGIIVSIPFDWPRYYLPVVPCIVIVIGFCLDTLIDRFYLLVSR